MEYRKIDMAELGLPLFSRFIRRQVVTKCWRKIDGEWVIKDISFIDDAKPDEYGHLVKHLKTTLSTGGTVFGAFEDGGLKGFASVEGKPIGSRGQYLDLSCMHVSQDMRGRGIGKRLFTLAAAWAGEHGAEKLYISAHSAVETQAFYKAMGCVEAEEYSAAHVEKEPADCQLELVL